MDPEDEWLRAHACMSSGYAMTTFSPQVLLHRYIMGAPSGVPIDHRNGRKLDNRKENLREVTGAENTINRDKPRKDSLSPYIGVTQHSPGSNRWGAYINCNKKRLYLGWFGTPEDANLARLLKEKELFGIQPRRLQAFLDAGIGVKDVAAQ